MRRDIKLILRKDRLQIDQKSINKTNGNSFEGDILHTYK